MTVKELKQTLTHIPDDYEVLVRESYGECGGVDVNSASCVKIGNYGILGFTDYFSPRFKEKKMEQNAIFISGDL